MNTIGKYISDLIIQHDCVIVPGLGGFVANYKPASLSDEKGLFMPPQKEIGFNRSLMHNDGLLVNHVAIQMGIAYADAQKGVEVFVNTLWEQLGDKNVAEISEIGILKKDLTGNLLFQPESNGWVLPEAFGLAPVHLPMNDVAEHHPAKQIQHSARQFVMPRIPHRQVAAGIALVAGLFLLTPTVHTPQAVSQGAMTSFPDISLIETAVVEATVDTNLAVVVPSQVQELVEVVKPSVSAAVNTQPAWYLIAASFPSENDAQMHCEKLVKNGYPNASVVAVDGKNRVAIESFGHREEAMQAMNNYREIKGFESVWLLRNKNN